MPYERLNQKEFTFDYWALYTGGDDNCRCPGNLFTEGFCAKAAIRIFVFKRQYRYV